MNPWEDVGRLVDTLDNYVAALAITLPDALRVQAFREALPEWAERLRSAYIAGTGENPWEV